MVQVSLSLQKILTLINMVYNFVASFGRVMTDACLVERLKEYCEFSIFEAPFQMKMDEVVGSSWPLKGDLQIDDLNIRYRKGLPLVIKNLDLSIETGEKVAILGRTGSGKSTLMLALMRILEPSSGRIRIDGVDISKIGLHKLRKSISIIPQDPFLMEGTLRFNLDQLGLHPNSRMIEVLNKLKFNPEVEQQQPKETTT